jgi:hypothetical protein
MDFFNKIKNFAKSFFANKKAIVFAFLFIFLLLSFFLPKNILAADNTNSCDSALKPVSSITEDAGGFVLKGILSAASIIPLYIGQLFFSASASLLQYITDQKTVGLSYTGFDNPVIAAGWPIMRDFANMMVVIGFVVVGIAFTLRLESYGSKKVLINLIIAALLINFSLPICGIFIDGSNIVMNYFLKASGNIYSKADASGICQKNSWWDTMSNSWWVGHSPLGPIVGTINFFKEGNYANTGATFRKAAFYWVGFFIIILFFFVFLFRYLALWLLVVFSPLAFVCYVFPNTKGIFSMWWKNFFQWCIIGIPAAFSLYLADQLLNNPQINKISTGFVATILTGFLPAALLLVGLLLSLQTSAMGANYAIKAFNWTKGKAMPVLKWTATAPAKAIKGQTWGRIAETDTYRNLKSTAKNMYAQVRGAARLSPSTDQLIDSLPSMGRKVKDIPMHQLTPEVVSHMSVNQIRAFNTASPVVRAHLRDFANASGSANNMAWNSIVTRFPPGSRERQKLDDLDNALAALP